MRPGQADRRWNAICARFGARHSVATRTFAFAGTKDKRGITVQRVTAFHIAPARLAGLNARLYNIRLGNFGCGPRKGARARSGAGYGRTHDSLVRDPLACVQPLDMRQRGDRAVEPGHAAGQPLRDCAAVRDGKNTRAEPPLIRSASLSCRTPPCLAGRLPVLPGATLSCRTPPCLTGRHPVLSGATLSCRAP